MKIAVVQFNAGREKEKNLNRAMDMVHKAADRKARFVLLPEVFIGRGFMPKPGVACRHAEPVDGQTIQRISVVAKDLRIFILAGSIYEASNNPYKPYNTSVLVGPRGEIVGAYRKINLFKAQLGKRKLNEANFFSSGRRPVLVRMGPFRVGLSICYDLRFPELYRYYFQRGANLLCVPSVFTKMTGQAHWRSLLRARAIENLSYVLAPNQVGSESRTGESYGHSLIVSPWGEVLAEGSQIKEEILYADIEMDTIKEARRRLPGC